MHLSQKGFTLIEVMVTVLIAVLITMAAVPAFKKNQERARYQAAVGVLMELGTAMNMVREDPEASTMPLTSMQIKNNASDFDFSQGLPDVSNHDEVVAWLQDSKYLGKLPLENEQYKGYKFYISKSGANCSQTGVTCTSTDAVACMVNPDASTAEYKCAWVDKTGLLRNN